MTMSRFLSPKDKKVDLGRYDIHDFITCIVSLSAEAELINCNAIEVYMSH